MSALGGIPEVIHGIILCLCFLNLFIYSSNTQVFVVVYIYTFHALPVPMTILDKYDRTLMNQYISLKTVNIYINEIFLQIDTCVEIITIPSFEWCIFIYFFIIGMTEICKCLECEFKTESESNIRIYNYYYMKIYDYYNGLNVYMCTKQQGNIYPFSYISYNI